ncbi:DNA polymerase III PolC-type [Trichinella pseudospiralis]
MLEIICHETNRYTLHKGEQGTWIDVIPIEIRENFGLLLLSGRKEPLFDDFRTRAEDKAASTTKCRLPELHLINWAVIVDYHIPKMLSCVWMNNFFHFEGVVHSKFITSRSHTPMA